MPSKKRVTRKSARKGKISSEQFSSEDTCFTIMPFGNWFDYYYETIYVPAIKATKLIPRRADDLYRPSAIVNDIWTLTQEAKVILADLSGKNPNVFYELGLAHALTKPAILVTEAMDDVPFDLRSLRVLVYDKNEPKWGDVLRQKIETAINEVLVSPLEAVLPTFLKVRESTKKTVSREEKELITLRQDVDLIKHQLQNISSPSTRISRRKSINDYAEGVEFAKSSLAAHMPSEDIIDLMVAKGVPERGIAERILLAAQNSLKGKKAQSDVSTATEEDNKASNGAT